MKHATPFTSLSRHIWHIPFLLGVLGASSAIANESINQLKDLRIGAVNARHFAVSHCRFWTKETDGAPAPKVIIETDFSIAWLNVKGRDMSFPLVNKNDYITSLQTPAGRIELTELADADAKPDALTLGLYRMNIRSTLKRSNEEFYLVAECQ